MESSTWRQYATDLDDAARHLEEYTGRLASEAGKHQPFAPHGDEIDRRTLHDQHKKLISELRAQANQARIKAEVTP